MIVRQFECNICRLRISCDADNPEMPARGTLCAVYVGMGIKPALPNCCGSIQICRRCVQQLSDIIAEQPKP